MAQSKTAPALDNDVKKLHQQLVKVLGGKRADEKPGTPYWDTSSTTFQDDFKARVAKQLKTYADQSAGSEGGESQSAAKQAGG